MSTTSYERGTSRSVYLYISAYLDDGRPFDATTLASKVGIEQRQAANALNYIVRNPQAFPGVERIANGLYKYVGDGPFGAAPAKPAERLLIVKVLADVDGRTLVMDEDSNKVYWMESVS